MSCYPSKSKKQKRVPQIFIRTQKGTITIDNDNLSVKQLVQQIFVKTKVPQKYYFLVASGSVLDCRKSLSDYNISKDNTIEMIIRPSGSSDPLLKRSIGENKWDSGIERTMCTLKPTLVQIDFPDTSKNIYYVYCPNGNRYQGNKELVEYQLGLDGYSFDEVENITGLDNMFSE